MTHGKRPVVHVPTGEIVFRKTGEVAIRCRNPVQLSKF